MTELRDYQLDVIEKWRETMADGKRRVILVAPTGAGKTHIAAAVIKDAISAGQRVLVLAHRREILLQTASKLIAHGVDHGLIQAGEAPRLGKAVQVASIPTLWSWAMRTRRIAPPPADLLVVDECHHAPARTWQKIIASYPGVPLIGLTATPCRADGRGLGGIFDAIVECPQVAELIDQKYLVRTRTYAPVDPDLKGVQTETIDLIKSLQMADFNRNPNGLGGFQPGQVANPGGRPKSQSRVQLWFLKHALEAGAIIVNLARNAQGTKAEHMKFTAAKEILDRSIGKSSQAIDLAVDLSVNKRLDEMTVEEIQEFRAKYVALTTAPMAIEHVLADDEPEQLPLLADEATSPTDNDASVEAETPAPPRPRGRPRKRPLPSTTSETN